MGRAEKRRNKRAEIALETKVNKLSNKDTLLIELQAMKKFNEYAERLGTIIDGCYFNAMRDTRVGEERAYKILEKAKKLIELEAERVGM